MLNVEDLEAVSPELVSWADKPPAPSFPLPSSSASSNKPSVCADCNPKKRLPATLYCPECNQKYCDACWADRGPHGRGDDGHDREPIQGGPVEDFTTIFRRLKSVFYKNSTTTTNESQEHEHHEHVLHTLWLTVTSSGSQLSFNERPRFRDALEEHHRKVQQQAGDEPMTYYPRLISFVGNTGTGKSSVIQILIRHLWESRISEQDLPGILVPVAGNSTDSRPTSSDIHLYHDPIEAITCPESPLLYADCEGFGAANYSAAANSRAKSLEDMEREGTAHMGQDDSGSRVTGWGNRAFNSAMRFMERPLQWLGSRTDRTIAVEELFPRLVYNVSDVVVYVVTEIKTMGKVLEKLVKWSRIAETSSVNRTSLPSLIVLINRCDPEETKQWGSDDTTVQILGENVYLMEENEIIRNRRDELAKFYLPHQSIADILSNSYAAVKFLRLPTANDRPRMKSQVQELHTMINSLTRTAHESRKANNMLLSSEQLHHLYRLTFDHFSKSTTSPFDFMSALFTVHPSPANLSATFFRVLQATFEAVKRGNQKPDHQPLADKIIAAVVPVICSTVAVDSRQRNFPGILRHIFRHNASDLPPVGEVREGSYERAVEKALKDFSESTLPCGYTYTSGSPGEETRICINGKKAHGSENSRHQDANGVHIGTGPYDESFRERFLVQWGFALAGELESLNTAKLPGLWDHHRETIKNLHTLVPGLDLSTLTCCVWCMRNVPTERLSCGHWICSSCVVGMGTKAKVDDRVFTITHCDQHSSGDLGGGKQLDPPLEFLNLPKTVGRRLLSLDEGGVRGVFQLELLAAIQDRLGDEIPIQDCFDLIGGTGIGGVNALGLGIQAWNVSKTIQDFRALVPRALKEQASSSFFIFFRRRSPVPCSLYNLTRSIQEAFGQDSNEAMATSLSRGTKTGGGPIRVFVTSTRQGAHGSGGMLLTNYLRQDVYKSHQDPNESPQKKQDPPKHAALYSIGEAAKATACFEPFFGPCTLSPGNHQHVGGAQDFACPAGTTLAEAQSLWSHMPDQDYKPDVLVSVGCGYEAPAAATSGNRNDCTGAEAMWHRDFGKRSPEELERCYIRLSPEFPEEKLPKADNVGILIDDFQEKTLNQDDLDKKVDLVARRLISTIFYFEMTSSESHKDGRWMIHGQLRCRFKQTSEITKAFGRKISSFSHPQFIYGTEEQELYRIDEQTLRVMANEGRFSVSLKFWAPSTDGINIKFTAEDFPAESISGSGSSLSS